MEDNIVITSSFAEKEIEEAIWEWRKQKCKNRRLQF